ncbi:probable serine hydrolase [Chrysoperla carnea]|uniref:probable serine hydrolase n=1 Tax=Chrysoperla carnea TaxID=189513 RepID=UPI001D077081|nr:probable serine hydrolase [Chrysoperla carnea]
MASTPTVESTTSCTEEIKEIPTKAMVNGNNCTANSTNGMTSNGIEIKHNKSNGTTECSNDNRFEEFQFTVPWGTVAGKWWGSRDRVPIICIHGWCDNCGTFDNLAPLLVDEGHSLLCLDLPGHGFSSHIPPGMYYYLNWDGVMLVRRIVKHYKWDKIRLMGHSLGGCISFLYAAVFPDEVSHFICIDIASPAVRSPEETVPKIGQLIDDFLLVEKNAHRTPKAGDYEKFVDLVHYAQHGNCTKDAVRVLLKRGMRQTSTDPPHFLFYADVRLRSFGLGFMYMHESEELAKQIKCNVLNIKANTRTVSLNMEYYDRICDIIKENAAKFEIHNVDGAHHLHLNDPNSIIHIVSNFLSGE